ncbi:hypothetical protein [Gorillibacterium sp. sgz5001074]|uniref:hypothetical protein n=1 Tax=Gorillibacterium sp. sgz5001074 TaxID=3446695 RepID=UPI003F6620FF
MLVTLVYLLLSLLLILMIAGLDVFAGKTTFVEALKVFYTSTEHYHSPIYLVIWVFALLWSLATDIRHRRHRVNGE